MRSLFVIAACWALSAPTVAVGAEVEHDKPGYMIVISRDVDPTQMGDYAKVAVPLLLQYGAKLLFVTEEDNNEILEGGPFPQSVRVFQFPSLQAARNYYQSDEYQRAIPLRAGNGKIDVILADSFVPDPKWSQ